MRVVLRVLTLPLAIGVAVFRSRALALLVCLWLVAGARLGHPLPIHRRRIRGGSPRSQPTARARSSAPPPGRWWTSPAHGPAGPRCATSARRAPASGGLRSALPERGPGSLLFRGLRWSSDERFHPQRRGGTHRVWRGECAGTERRQYLTLNVTTELVDGDETLVLRGPLRYPLELTLQRISPLTDVIRLNEPALQVSTSAPRGGDR